MKIGVIGGGAWGTALAQVAAAGGPVLLWAFERDVVEAINADHVNPIFLAGVPLSDAIQATSDLQDLATCEALLVVTPAQHMRRLLAAAPVGDAPADPLLEGDRGGHDGFDVGGRRRDLS